MANEERPTRGRSSKVDLLPENIRNQLHAMLREKSITQQEILDSINDLIGEEGLPADLKLSRSGLNRYATQVEQVGASLRQMREATAALTAQLGDKPTGEVTKLILEMGRGQLFKLFMAQANDPDAEVDVGMLKEAMLAAQRLESTAMQSHKREKEIRQAFAEEVAAKTEQIVTQAGLTRDTAAQIRREILGIA
jgi:soluble cytochrome b562